MPIAARLPLAAAAAGAGTPDDLPNGLTRVVINLTPTRSGE
jgi:hypothetical protein